MSFIKQTKRPELFGRFVYKNLYSSHEYVDIYFPLVLFLMLFGNGIFDNLDALVKFFIYISIPKPHNRPSHFSQQLVDLAVPCHIPLYFLLPKVSICFRLLSGPEILSMKKRAVAEDRNLIFRNCYVRVPGNAGIIFPIPDPRVPKCLTQFQFYRRVF